MFILQHLLAELKNEFAYSRKGKEREIWFVYTLVNFPLYLENRSFSLVGALLRMAA